MKKIYLLFVFVTGFFLAKAQFPAPYCAEDFASSIEPITKVVFAGISNTSSPVVGGTAHENFTAVTGGAVQQAGNYQVQIQGNTDGNYTTYIRLFADWNHDNDFLDAGESYDIGTVANSTGADGVEATATVFVPGTALTGTTRIRFSKKYGSYPDPCNSVGYGQAEDYVVTVSAAACAVPANLHFTSVTGTNASISWSAATGITTYEYAITTLATPPASGISTIATTGTAGSLPANTVLYAYVRSLCSPGVFTGWVQKKFTVINDLCADATTLNSGATLSGTNVNADENLPDDCSSSDGAYDVWYKVNAQLAGNFTISVTGVSPFDAIIAVYTGNCGNLTPVDCTDNTGDGATETLTITNTTPGTTYYVRVYGWFWFGVTNPFGTFTISASGTALPVTGVNLAAVRSGKNIQLNWQTLTELNNAGFELQRSADGNNFTSFASVATKANGGNSTAAIQYSAEDVKPFSGANYYRLKQKDKDGKISYSNTVYLKGLPVSTLTLSAVYPNPATDVLRAAIQSPAAENITFVITDMTGKIIRRQTNNIISGDNTVTIHVTNLPSGNYLLKAICNNGCESAYQKFSKQ